MRSTNKTRLVMCTSCQTNEPFVQFNLISCPEPAFITRALMAKRRDAAEFPVSLISKLRLLTANVRKLRETLLTTSVATASSAQFLQVALPAAAARAQALSAEKSSPPTASHSPDSRNLASPSAQVDRQAGSGESKVEE